MELSNIQKNIDSTLKKDKKKAIIEKNQYNPFSGDERPGSRVFVVPLEKPGIIDEIDKSNRTAVIIIGNSITSRYDFEDLLVPDYNKVKKEKNEQKQQPDKASSEIIPLTIQTSLNTSDIRGLRVDDALNKLESDLDRMIRNNISTAVVIHGHGTGALKKAVREWLNFSYYVNSFRPGEQNEGGDGVSIVFLRD